MFCVGVGHVRATSAKTAVRCSEIFSATWIVCIVFGINQFVSTWLENISQLGLPLINALLHRYNWEDKLNLAIFTGIWSKSNSARVSCMHINEIDFINKISKIW